ncbi:MAG: polysaccharide export protein [Gammaproteobacteria bacterium]|nr:polysaccharide export protein [Gammaproteobacteria bacterium]NIR90083.1 polysaccharide export protein [Gammaproteobacteria bacterium]NIU03287.1 polysaccharide export protein [Gammaproteobacteria bacterium]NIV50781.1 polysaccharide export protein [Gammaproteobacteria bacterium]NIV75367.1 polysaccharide export protein [Gammaproteobacteria bacterium]
MFSQLREERLHGISDSLVLGRRKSLSFSTLPIIRACCLGLALLVAALLCATSASAQDIYSYRIKPGDVLQISVWKEPTLAVTPTVRPDGAISMPLAGDIVAEGRTVEELRSLIADRLTPYISDPVVSVAVQEFRGNVFYVLGKVAEPGEYIIRRDTDVMQALSLAGGTTKFADLDDIRILRRENGKQFAIRFRYSDVERGSKLDQNILLRSGDIIVVP